MSDNPNPTVEDLLGLLEHAVGHAMTTLAFNSSTRPERRAIAEAVVGAIYGADYQILPCEMIDDNPNPGDLEPVLRDLMRAVENWSSVAEMPIPFAIAAAMAAAHGALCLRERERAGEHG